MPQFIAKSVSTLLTCLAIAFSWPVAAELADDLAQFQNFFLHKHEDLALVRYADGAYALRDDGQARLAEMRNNHSFEAILSRGKALYSTPFADGKGYASCFRGNGLAIATDYPYYDTINRKVKTFALEINECRSNHGEEPYQYDSEAMVALLSYLTDSSRKSIYTVIVPDNADALAAYENGKQFFFARRGKWNVACAHCHMDHAGKNLRDQTLSPALGITTHFPAYYAQWSGVGTLHRRFSDCMQLIGAKPFPEQSEEYRNLEFFLGYMSNGVPVNGPDVRR